MDLDKLNISSSRIHIPKSMNKLRYFRGVVLKEITTEINRHQGDVVYTPEEVLEHVIKPLFYYEWVYDEENDSYTQKTLSLADISDSRMYQLINDTVIWAEMTFNIEISKPNE